MPGLKIPLSRPVETTDIGFVYNAKRISLARVEPGLTQSILLSEAGGDWELASQEYENQGELEKAAQCAEKAGDQQRALRLAKQAGTDVFRAFLQVRKLPLLHASLFGDPILVAGRWEPLTIDLENQGFGPALNIAISLKNVSIDAKIHCLPALASEERCLTDLEIFPAQPGLINFELSLDYAGPGRETYTETFPFTLKVAPQREAVFQNLGQILIQPSSGPIYNGPVDQSQGKVEAGGTRVEGDVGLIKSEPPNPDAQFQFCPYCGKKFHLPKTPLHCPYCGERLQ